MRMSIDCDVCGLSFYAEMREIEISPCESKEIATYYLAIGENVIVDFVDEH